MIKWIGPMFDSAGYTDANRNYVCALNLIKADLLISPIYPITKNDEINDITNLILQLSKKKISYKYVIHHFVPEQLEHYIEKNKINIGYNTWETDTLPLHWVEKINTHLKAVFVPSYFNKQVYENSGVKIPIEVIPHCLDCEQKEKPHTSLSISNKFKFISVFQWTERKNPITLLKAYFSEFTQEDDVILILKTYRSNFSATEQNNIKDTINSLKNNMNLKYYPPIFFIKNQLTKTELMTLYQQSDCFVLPTRAEGFGIPYAEACLNKNTIIATAYGGQLDFLDQKYTDFIDYQLTPVSGMAWIPNYNAHMNWSDASVHHLKKLMRKQCMFKQNNIDSFNAQQLKAKKDITKKLNYKIIGEQLVNSIIKYGKGV